MTSSAAAIRLGFEPFVNSSPVELRTNWSDSDIKSVISATYRQVFGNEHLMLSERLTSAESLLASGNISVREFVRALAQSELYRTKFFSSTPQVRFIELNFKHLLGRAPHDEAEITEHVNRYIEHGYEAEINSYIDSDEYQENFGEAIVPYYRAFETQRGSRNVDFNRMFQLYRGYANSDRAQGKNKSTWLTADLAQNSANPIRTPHFGQALSGTTGDDRGQVYRVRAVQADRGRTTQIRRSVSEYLVSYDQLSATLQRLNQRGSRITQISLA
ncbi:phycobilisome linker polypeptide [Pseudanabaena galeata UHCC 0370]|jgi:phycocyanin-associated rod linker protein|uniref:Phycobilisome linker polypeptide n=1 Tax=Pseudanabaena galeata UHCC 0370 TaxID=3110310 RepID=A0ABU5TLH4_9CYAN|nr:MULTISPECIES: phycobilisome linker polypeptide [Pseudanabaena]MEA5479014.1 phycobilisome linker polypeptide [Pseudanabaena galeata UHCC 0370]MEA5485881.1 phycobilisome linker polypeptide [Pseudanabaena sp. CCNP1317]WGS71300.1 phycobilisome linker polypeptide [Pseudanabaena galeata CCNP1313]